MPTYKDKSGKVRYRRPVGKPPIYNFGRLKEVGDAANYMVEDAAKVRAAASNFKKRNPGWNYTTDFIETGVGPRLRLTVIPLSQNRYFSPSSQT